MNLCIDQGNSKTKIGIFDQDKLIDNFVVDNSDKNGILSLITRHSIDKCIISSVISNNNELIDEFKVKVPYVIELNHELKIPIVNRYLTPETLGNDRLAAVVGASFLKPNSDILVIDAGTAITYDFIDGNKNYLGGNIAPGINLRLRSLNEFTSKLPLVEPKNESPLIGNTTESALISGVIYGIAFEIDGYINELKIKYPQLSTFLTGGSTFYFVTKLKSAIFAERNLVLIGLNRILQYNVQK
ncbi:MAG: type III pantothenate kinase [Paludibacter sp.]|nr:type III pantothenate kinase [Paludibacter sp.]